MPPFVLTKKKNTFLRDIKKKTNANTQIFNIQPNKKASNEGQKSATLFGRAKKPYKRTYNNYIYLYIRNKISENTC